MKIKLLFILLIVLTACSAPTVVDIKPLNSGLNDPVFEGDESNAPHFLQIYTDIKPTGTISNKITWWAKAFSITDIYPTTIDGLSGAVLPITTKDGLSTNIKLLLASEIDVLFDSDLESAENYRKFSCKDNPSCNGVPWFVQTHLVYNTGQENDWQYLYCPDTVEQCLTLKRWMEDLNG